MKIKLGVMAIAGMMAFQSCQNNSGDKASQTDTLKADTTKVLLTKKDPNIDTCMRLLDSSTIYMTKGIKGELSKEKVNEKIKPIMDKYFSLYKNLKPEDTTQVYDYRVKKLNELIDLQVKKDKGQ